MVGKGYIYLQIYVLLTPEINEPESRMLLSLLCPRLEGSAVRLLHMFSILRSGREVRVN